MKESVDGGGGHLGEFLLPALIRLNRTEYRLCVADRATFLLFLYAQRTLATVEERKETNDKAWKVGGELVLLGLPCVRGLSLIEL